MNYRRPELRDRLASEYVLGTLHGRARARFQQLLRDDLALRDRVAFWERELTPMAAPLSVAAPSAKVWEGIAARVAPRERAQQARPGGFARWFALWFDSRTLGSVAAGLFLGVSATMIGPSLLRGGATDLSESQLPESYVGVLATADGRTGLIVSSRRHGKVMDVKRVQPVAVPAGQTLFLWAIEGGGGGGKARPIGPVPQGAFVQVALAQTSEQLFASAAELALSVEPTGSTPAQPGGPFVYRGLCGKLWRVKAPS
jgi:anti-sigma-K factor RskA